MTPTRYPETTGPSSAFSLVELLVVIAIMAILAGVVALNVVHRPEEARISAAKMQVKLLKSSVQHYKIDHGVIPTMAQGLHALVERPTVGPIPEQYPTDGYLDSREVPLDPWENAFIYLVPGRSGESFEILCYGSDGEPGGVDGATDLSSSDP